MTNDSTNKVGECGGSKKGSLSGTIANVSKVAFFAGSLGISVWFASSMVGVRPQTTYPGYNIKEVMEANEVKPAEKSVALIPLYGMINSSGEGVNSELVLGRIDRAVEDNVGGFIFEIDSPGGVVLPSKDIAKRIQSLEQPKVAVIRNLGASGAYWIASSCDYIIADETSMVGSIGVRMDRFDVSGLMKKLGIKYDPVYAGTHKTMGTPFEKLPQEGRTILAEMVSELHEVFITEVATGRNLSLDEVRPLATGRVFLGSQAKEVGLVDYLGGRDDAARWMFGQLNKKGYNLNIYKQPPKPGFLNLASEFGNSIGEGIGNVFLEYTIKQP